MPPSLLVYDKAPALFWEAQDFPDYPLWMIRDPDSDPRAAEGAGCWAVRTKDGP